MNTHLEETPVCEGSFSAPTQEDGVASVYSLQLFEPDRNTIYTVDEASHFAGMARHMVLVCCKHGLVSAMTDPAYGGYFFDYEAVKMLRRLEALREVCGFNVFGLKLTLDLTREIDRLREQYRVNREQSIM